MSFELAACEPCSTVSQAVRFGQTEEMERLIGEGHPIDAFDNRGWRPLHEAAYGNFVQCLTKLIQINDIDINCQSFEGVTPLLVACQNNHTESVDILLNADANPNIADHVDNYPLQEAVKGNNMVMVKLLVDHGSNVNCQLYCGTSPLHTCAAEGMIDMARYLLENGGSLETKEEYNITPIFTAAQHGQPDTLLLLLKAALDTDKASLVNYPAEDGATPLFLASQEGHYECVKILLDHGADANIMTMNEPKALPVQAALEFGHLKTASILLPATDKKYFYDCDCSLWYTVLTSAPYAVRKKAVELLIHHGTNVNYKHTKDMDENYTRFPKILRFLPTESMLFLKCISPLTLSMIFEQGNLVSPIVSMLIKNGAEVNAQRLYEFPPIVPALEGRKLELVKMLIKAGAYVNLYHPKIQGNFAILLCLHQWKSLNLLLKVGAEVQSLFDLEKYHVRLENIVSKYKALKDVDKPVGIYAKVDDAVAAAETTKSLVQDQSFIEDSGNNLAENQENLHIEESQFKTLEFTSFIPFETFLVAARQVMSAGPYKVGISTALFRILYFAPNICLKGNLWSFLESNQDMVELKKLTDIPRTLAHLCRLSVRTQLGPVKLLDESETREQFHLPKNIWDFIFFHEIED